MTGLRTTMTGLVLIAAASACYDVPNLDSIDGSDPSNPMRDGGVRGSTDGSDPGEPEPERPPPMVEVTGRLVELSAFLQESNSATVARGALTTVGLKPDIGIVTDDFGAFSLTVPQNGRVLVYATGLNLYPSYTELAINDVSLMNVDIYAASSFYMEAIAAAYGVDLLAPFPCHAPPEGALEATDLCIYGIIFGQLLDDGTAGNGTPRPVAGMLAEDFTLTGGPMNSPWFKMGPYFLAADGQPDPNATASITSEDPLLAKYRGGYFVIFAEIPQTKGPPGVDLRLAVNHGGGQTQRWFGPIDLRAFRPYAVTRVTMPETGAPIPPPPTGQIDFDSRIYPLFLPLAEGGFGCQGCHTTLGGISASGGLNLAGGPELAYLALDPARYPQRVNLANPAESTLLKRPLYEATGPQDHPIYAFIGEREPAYQLLLAWIRGGATRTASTADVSFVRDVRPIFTATSTAGGAGCVSCHGVAPGAGNFYVGGTALELYRELTEEARSTQLDGQLHRIDMSPGAAERSLVLVKPLLGSTTPHAVKLFISTADQRYQMIYRWIVEGHKNN